MDTQIRIETGQWKIKIILGIGGLVTLIILAFLYRLEVGLILLAIGGISAARLGFWARSQHRQSQLQERKLLAETRQVELEATRFYWEVEQTKAIANKLRLESYFIQQKAGTFVLTDLPFRFFPTASASAKLDNVLALPAPALDFFDVMSDDKQVYAIVGPQRIGKSILAQHLAQYLTRIGRTCIVVGTKAATGEWLHCKKFIGNEQVPEALSSILAETTQRLKDNRTTPPLCLFLDDWLNTVALDDKLAEQFFLESATRMLTAGIIPYFLLQSDSKMDWGTRHGAMLKDNFTHLLLTAPRENGQLNHSKLTGSIRYAGDKQLYPVKLPLGLPTFGNGQPDVTLAQPEAPIPNEQEQRIIDLFNGGASKNTIARQIYGQHGGKQNQLINEILNKWGLE